MRKKLFETKIKQRVFFFFFCCCAVTAISCGSKKYEFKNSEEAVNYYNGFYSNLRKEKSTDAKGIENKILEWQETADTVFSFLKKDSAFSRRQDLVIRFYSLTDSVKQELSRLTETWKCTYNDVYNIKVNTSPFKKDAELEAAVKEAAPFFDRLDSIPPAPISKEDALKKYRNFIDGVLHEPVQDKRGMMNFIMREDVCYRNFLAHLYEMDKEKVSDITQKTEQVCANIFQLARDGKIDTKDVLVYMSMRTARRLLLNAEVCLDDINEYDMKSKMQGNAYLWMIIQPYISVDAFVISTLTEKNKEAYKKISQRIPQSKKFADTFNIEITSLEYLLPQQLLKIYILSL